MIYRLGRVSFPKSAIASNLRLLWVGLAWLNSAWAQEPQSDLKSSPRWDLQLQHSQLSSLRTESRSHRGKSPLWIFEDLDFETATDSEIRAKIVELSEQEEQKVSPQELQARVEDTRLLVQGLRQHQGSADEFNRFLGSRLRERTFEDKMRFFRSYGAALLDNFDWDRSVGEKSDDSVVSGLAGRYEGKFLSRSGTCRHIHQSMLRLMKESGVESAYGLSYVHQSGYHLNLVVQDPQNPSRVHLLNYGDQTTHEGRSGSRSLRIGNETHQDAGISFHLWGADDAPKDYYLSEKGKVLYAATGGDLSEHSPLARLNASLSSVGVRLRKDERLGIFFAHEWGEGSSPDSQNEAKEVTTGLSYHARKKPTPSTWVDAGASVYASVRDIEEHQRSLQTGGVYARAEAGYEKPIGQHLSLGTSANLAYTGFFSELTPHRSNELGRVFLHDGHGSLVYFGKLKLGSGKLKSDTLLRVDTSLQLADVTASFSEGLTYYVRSISLQEKLKWGDQVTLSGTLVCHPGVDQSILGDLQILIEPSTSLALMLGVQGPLSEDVPMWLEGAAPRVQGGVKYRLLDQNRLELELSGQHDWNSEVTLGSVGVRLQY